jgi:hypothetical protein
MDNSAIFECRSSLVHRQSRGLPSGPQHRAPGDNFEKGLNGTKPDRAEWETKT